jgi:polygalacturonase
VEVKNCHVGHAGGLVVFGSETSGGIRHVRIHDCKADGCVDVVRFKTRMGRGGVVEDVVYENIEADGVRQVVNFNMDAFSTTWLPEQFRAPAPADIGTPIFRDITVRNVKVKNCGAAGHIVGLTESPIKNLKLENIDIQNADKGFTVKNIHGFSCDNVKVNGKSYNVPDEFKLVAKEKAATP